MVTVKCQQDIGSTRCAHTSRCSPRNLCVRVWSIFETRKFVLYPFSGRGTTLLESLLLGRKAIAADINPVAYCISAAKANTPSLNDVLAEIDGLEWMYLRRYYDTPTKPTLPDFFNYAFHPDTLEQLLSLRTTLNWRGKRVHRFIAALVLGYLHGEADRSDFYFSNQMPHSISTKPDYSVRYWQAHGMSAPHRDVFTILRNRAESRLQMGSRNYRRGGSLRRAAHSERLPENA